MLKKHIPNSITCCNLICGCLATLMASRGDFELALGFMVSGAIFDFFDGFVARLLKVSSPIGKELDSLADVVTFGVAPSMMLWSALDNMHLPYLVPFIAFLLAAFSALRLAKFNLDERQTTSFLGLPTPANALFWASLLMWEVPAFPATCLLLLLSCWLLVSEVPMFAMKFKHYGWKDNEVRYCFLVLAVALVVLCGPVRCWAVIIPIYILISIVTSLIKK